MNRTKSRVMTALLIIASLLLPGATVNCDCEDGEIEIDFDGFCSSGSSGCGDSRGGGCRDGGCGSFFFDFWWDD